MVDIKVVHDDITALEVDAIVNSADSDLLGGAGVDGAIHHAAGPYLVEECKDIRDSQYREGMPEGEAVITKGYNLKAKFVIHTVGPKFDRHHDQDHVLIDCFRNSLALAEDHNLKSIAFPAISAGSKRYPKKRVAKIAKEVFHVFHYSSIKEVIMCLYSYEDYRIFKEVFNKDGL